MFFISPITYLFYPPFWKSLKNHSTGYGLLYLLYVTVILTIIGGIYFFKVFTPKILPAITPVWKALPPEMVWKQSGVTVNNDRPFPFTIYGEFNGMIDTSISNKQPLNFEKYNLYLTHTHLYVKDKDKVYKIIPLTVDKKENTSDIGEVKLALEDVGNALPKISVAVLLKGTLGDKVYSLEPATLKKYIDKGWTYIVVFLFVLIWSTLYSWKMFVALIYSLIGLILNSIMKTKASFGKIYGASLFALTPAMIIQAVDIMVHDIPIANSLLGGFIITVVYLAMTMGMWREKASNATEPHAV